MKTLEQLRTIYTQYQRQADSDPLAERIVLDNITRFVWHNQQTGSVMYSQLNLDTVESAIKSEIAYFSEKSYAFEWKLYNYDTPDDLGKRLKNHGFIADEVEAIMVLPIADAPQKLLTEPTFDIREATTPEMFADLDAVYYSVWKDDPFAEATPTRMSDWFLPRFQQNPESLSIFIVYIDDKPVSYGRVEFAPNDPFAGLWGGSTLPAYRRRGIYTQMVAKRLQTAKDRGCEYVVVDARLDTSMPILKKLGFMQIATATAYNWYPPEG